MLGLVDENYFDTLGEQNKLKLLDPIQVGRKVVKLLKSKGCELVVCLTHMLNKSDREMVENLEDVDIFLGGHEHGYMIYKNKERLAVKSGSNFESFNEITLEFSQQKIEQTTRTLPEYKLPNEDCYSFIERVAKYDYDDFMSFAFQFQRQKEFLNVTINKFYVEEMEVADKDYLEHVKKIEEVIS